MGVPVVREGTKAAVSIVLLSVQRKPISETAFLVITFFLGIASSSESIHGIMDDLGQPSISIDEDISNVDRSKNLFAAALAAVIRVRAFGFGGSLVDARRWITGRRGG